MSKDNHQWFISLREDDYPYWMSMPNDGDLTVTITPSPHKYNIYIGKSDEPKLPPDYNPTRKHWQSPRYVPGRRK